MENPKSIGHILFLIQSGQLNEAKAELETYLINAPTDDKAWTIASLLTSDFEQRKEYLTRVFNLSEDTDLANWAFQNLGEMLSEDPAYLPTSPPDESLVINTEKRISLNNLIRISAEESKSTPDITKVSSFEEEVGIESPSPTEITYKSTQNKFHQLFSVKRLGEWIIIIGGLILILAVYSAPFRSFFINIRLSPFYYCFLPMLVFGLVIIVIGFFVDKK